MAKSISLQKCPGCSREVPRCVVCEGSGLAKDGIPGRCKMCKGIGVICLNCGARKSAVPMGVSNPSSDRRWSFPNPWDDGFVKRTKK